MNPGQNRLTRRIAGARAQSNGAQFENLFKGFCERRGIVTTRFPDGCKVIGANKIIRVKTPWDWILTWQGRTALIDTKTSNTTAFPNSAIEPHQVAPMLAHQTQMGIAGYVIHLAKANRVYFVPASALHTLIGVRGSDACEHPEAVLLGAGVMFEPLRIFP